MDHIYREVGRNIRARRRKLGLTLEDLAEATGFNPGYLGQIERDVKKASLLTLELVAHALRLPVAKLFGRTGPIATVSNGARLEALLRSNTPAERRIIVSTMRRLAADLKSLR